MLQGVAIQGADNTEEDLKKKGMCVMAPSSLPLRLFFLFRSKRRAVWDGGGGGGGCLVEEGGHIDNSHNRLSLLGQTYAGEVLLSYLFLLCRIELKSKYVGCVILVYGWASGADFEKPAGQKSVLAEEGGGGEEGYFLGHGRRREGGRPTM